MALEQPLRDLQGLLLAEPEAGDLDAGTGGLRKIRMPDPRRGKGKRSGSRVHYLWLPHCRRIYFMYVYAKDEATTLTKAEKNALRHLVQAIKAAVGETIE